MQIQSMRLENQVLAVRCKAPELAADRRLPVHFILVLDTSESMLDGNKLENVKHSASLVLPFLGPNDAVSVITFGSESKIHCRALSCTATNKEIVGGLLERIRVDGATNLSSALLSLRTILSQEAAGPAGHKVGVLLLTDGHANRGVYNDDGLSSMLARIYTEFSAVAFHFVGYGTDHNAELLKGMAETTQGSYSIVGDKEGAATVTGDTLGSLFSCAAQQVVLQCPAGATLVEGGSYRMSSGGLITIGDMYENGEAIVLLRLPEGGAAPVRVTVRGIALPSMESFEAACEEGEGEEREEGEAQRNETAAFREAVQMTMYRYTCAELFRTLARMVHPTAASISDLRTRLAAFRETLAAADGTNPVIAMLLEECKSVEESIVILEAGQATATGLYQRVSQHAAFTSMGRGTAQGIHSAAAALSGATAPPAPRRPRRRVSGPATPMALSEDESEDPAASAPPAAGYLTSPLRSNLQRRVGALMASMSAAPDDPNMTQAAADVSRMA